MLDQQSNTNTAKALSPVRLTCKVLICIVLSAVIFPIFVHYIGVKPVSEIRRPYPKIVIYKLRKTPDMDGAHGLDFSQMYLSAQNFAKGQEIYFPVDFENWRRGWSATYHPLIYWLYIPIGKLPFSYALVVHNLLGILVFLFSAFFGLKAAGCRKMFPLIALTCLSLFFLTPIGLLHLERGQFDLYTATAYLSIVVFFISQRASWAIAAGAISSLKITSWIFLALFWSFGVFLKGFLRGRVWIVPLVIFGLLLAFIQYLSDWYPAFAYLLFDTRSYGPSFTRILPYGAAKLLPFLATILLCTLCAFQAYWLRKKESSFSQRSIFQRIFFPFAISLALQTAGYTSVTHDYRLVAFLGLVPCLAIWVAINEHMSQKMIHLVSYTFGFMLLILFRVPPFTHLSHDAVAYWMLGFSIFYLLVALVLLFPFPKKHGATAAQL